MKLSLSTNWCNRSIESGEEIADKAVALGFDELELGFHTTMFQVQGFKKRLDRIPVGSVHAFCPVPISAPQGYPELYSLATSDENARAIARVHVKKNIEFAAGIGADTVVLHAGRVPFSSFFSSSFNSHSLSEILREAEGNVACKPYAKALEKAKKRRCERGKAIADIFVREVEALVPVLEKNSVTLAFENLPYLEAFPDEAEMEDILGRINSPFVGSWFDTGHARVRECRKWDVTMTEASTRLAPWVRGMHLNDVTDIHDDHFAPGKGKVDFASLKPLAQREGVLHVIEPHSEVTAEDLKAGLELVRRLWA